MPSFLVLAFVELSQWERGRRTPVHSVCLSLEDHSHLMVFGFIYGKFAVTLIADFVTDGV